MIDFGRELDEMRINYYNKPLKRLSLPRESWVMEDRILSRIYIESDYLIRNGTICYAGIVQANTSLYSLWLPGNCPANLVYATEEWVAREPSVLLNIARDLYSFKGRHPSEVPENLRRVVATITDERDRSAFYFDITGQNGYSARINFNANMIFRQYLPGFRLRGSIFPVIAAPENCSSVLILPKQYWTKNYIYSWNHKEI